MRLESGLPQNMESNICRLILRKKMDIRGLLCCQENTDCTVRTTAAAFILWKNEKDRRKALSDNKKCDTLQN